MNIDLLKAGIRYNAIYVASPLGKMSPVIRETTANFVANMAKLGYTVEEDLLHQLNALNAPDLLTIYEAFVDVLQVKNNWTPLVKSWDIPTGEKRADHWITFIANVFPGVKGDRLACGHLIPFNTFPLERYNGCPFCGTPFVTSGTVYSGQGSKLKVLVLWTDTDMQQVFEHLLQSKTALDATQAETIKTLIRHYTLPEVTISMKETQMLVIDTLVHKDNIADAGKIFQTPVDIMRYLWYKHTGYLQLIEPKVIIKRSAKNNRHMLTPLNTEMRTAKASKESLKLRYNRKEAKIVANWLNDLPMKTDKAAELMHPKRAMWVRFIRALRLAEYSRSNGMENLKALLDVFYHKRYEVWSARVNYFRLKSDASNTFALLKERPGLFARSLFANILWFGRKDTLSAFEEIADKIPARLLLTLNSYASIYFDPSQRRIVKPLGGTSKVIKANRLVNLYPAEELKEMISDIEGLCLRSMEARYAAQENDNHSIFIDPSLYFMPLPIGDRAEAVQDLPSALMGTKFPIEGNKVRLFMQWGKGLPAQHLDMDLSCQIAYEDSIEVCSYYNLAPKGAKHSGDIRHIPNRVGTAEYIELDLDELERSKSRFVSFVCNAYSNGSISPNLVIGWMHSANPMKINEKTGVAYDPSCVQYRVRVTRTLAKGLLFGILDVAQREITWMEQPFGGQTVANLSFTNVRTLLTKLKAKTTIGNLLALKAKAQGLILVEKASEADEAYTRQWAMDIARITKLLID